ncbi:MAG: right-handed parallel beta-helix repeat-containing protein [Bryobacteraceae bacterium]
MHRLFAPGALAVFVFVFAFAAAPAHPAKVQFIRQALRSATGMVHLPDGVVELDRELEIPAGTHDLEIVGGRGTVLRASTHFRGRAIFTCTGCAHITLRNFSIDGNRAALERPLDLAPPENAFRAYYNNNGLLFDQVRGLTITHVTLRLIANFAILVSRSSGIRINHVTVGDSGSRNRRGRNNSTGGILIEEGSSDFQVAGCVLRNIRGNAIWTHSLYSSPRNHDGLISGNRIDTVARDAIQVGHATRVRVENNSGVNIGYPPDLVDKENDAGPVAIDTAGNVDDTSYSGNRFTEIDGKCVDLDGFHDGEVRANTCLNRQPPEAYPFGHFAIVMNNNNPDMRSQNIRIVDNRIDGTKFGGIFVMGTGHRIIGNQLLNLNRAHCNENAAKFGCYYLKGEDNLLETGIYLGRGIRRLQQTTGNTIRGNHITGYKMKTRCILTGPGVSRAAQTIQNNVCEDTP